MTDAVVLAVASALASKAAEAAFAAGRSACGALVKVVRDRFSRDDSAAKALEVAQRRPEDEWALTELARALECIMKEDASFAAEIRDLWPRARMELSAAEGGVVNSVTGTVSGHLIQARDVHIEGGLHLGDVRSSSPP